MLTLKLQAKDYELTLLPPPHKLESEPYPKQSQDQSLFQAEHFRLKSCLSSNQLARGFIKRVGLLVCQSVLQNCKHLQKIARKKMPAKCREEHLE